MRRAPISVPSIREWAIGAFCNFVTSVRLRTAIELFDRDCGRVGRFNARATRQQTTEPVSRRVSLRSISAPHDHAAIAKRSESLSCRIVCDEPVCTSSENALAGQQGPGGADDGHHEATGQDTDHRIGDGLQHRWSSIVGSGRCPPPRADARLAVGGTRTQRPTRRMVHRTAQIATARLNRARRMRARDMHVVASAWDADSVACVRSAMGADYATATKKRGTRLSTGRRMPRSCPSQAGPDERRPRGCQAASRDSLIVSRWIRSR